jgi:hypothetical protein
VSRVGARRVTPAVVILVVGTLALIAAHAPGAGAVAVAEGSGELHGGTFGVGIDASTAGQQGVPVDAGSASLPRLVHYESTPLPAGRHGGLENVCNAAGPAVNGPPPVVFGWLYDVVAFSADDRVISDTHVCVPFPDPNDPAVPPPPVFPVAPTIGDVWRAVGLPRPVVGVNPVSRGVTGLPTRLWSGGARIAPIAVTLGAYRITGTARVVEYRFSTDEGYIRSSIGPGDATMPAALHEFAFKGAHSLSVTSVWRATATMTGPGGAAPVPIEINAAVLTATVAYPVVEVRTRLVG